MSSEANGRHPTGNPGESPRREVQPDLVRREEVRGRHPGDRVVRIPRHPLFRQVAPGTLLPRRRAVEPQGGWGRLTWRAKRFLIGEPISTDREVFERLTKLKALAVLSSDALSSVAYSVEATMRILIAAGVGALTLTLPLTLVIVLLLVIVATSYQQTIRAYPSGGGSYIVAHENLGVMPGLAAGGALLVGYVLTAAVSIAAGVDALISAFPELESADLALAAGAIFLMTLMNMRGVRESGTIFAAPTYVFLVSIFGMLGLGLWRVHAGGGIDYVPVDAPRFPAQEPLAWFLILSAFSKGCSAMTGTEAISNAVPAFRPPESRNARITLMVMAGLLGTMVIGIAYLTSQIGILPDPDEHVTVLSELTRLVVGDGWYFYLVQFATALILFLAANTSYTGFPWLLNVMARDRYVPHWFGLRGDRLAFSFGIVTLSLFSIALIVAFSGRTESLLSLYAIGVFAAFTLSQSGMTVHWLRGREKGWRRSIAVNGLGAVSTGLATVVIGITKFGEGAWLVIMVVPALMGIFILVHRHYAAVSRQMEEYVSPVSSAERPLALVTVAAANPVTREALRFAKAIGAEVIAVHVATDAPDAGRIKQRWAEVGEEVPLVTIESPYRLLIPPLVAYVSALREMAPDRPLLVVLPELVPRHWWEQLLHNQTALRLKAALLFQKGVMVVNMPYHLVGQAKKGA
ncbi:MAG: APC family permease [Chloroflexi bacterium]|nr:APC family permease [Chloroflexota bacterium]MCL5110277.1 APC family permease [Chloroflexota bacterium]